ncbi:MAG: hypothetical protein V3T99_03800 [Nitrososphaerales archaeon]
MSSQLERALNLGYEVLQDSLPEESVPVNPGGVRGFRTTVVTPIDDPLDSLASTDTDVPDYLEISIRLSWFAPGNDVTDSVSIIFTPERSW